MISNDEPTDARAYVLLNVEIGLEEKMMDELKAIPEVKEAHQLYGVYDIIAKIKTETMQYLKYTITWKIRRQDKVRSMLTMIVI